MAATTQVRLLVRTFCAQHDISSHIAHATNSTHTTHIHYTHTLHRHAHPHTTTLYNAAKDNATSCATYCITTQYTHSLDNFHSDMTAPRCWKMQFANAGRGESGWCLDRTSTPGAWRHAEVQFLLPGVFLPIRFCPCMRHQWSYHREVNSENSAWTRHVP